MKPFHLIIAGGRDLTNYAAVKQLTLHHLKPVLESGREIVIISGNALGADQLGERLAKEMGWKVIVMPADWGRYGRSAGFRRNVNMATIADALMAFWDGSSKGTGHMIDIAKERGLQVAVELYRNVTSADRPPVRKGIRCTKQENHP